MSQLATSTTTSKCRRCHGTGQIRAGLNCPSCKGAGLNAPEIKVGDGMTETLFTDSHAYTVIAVSPNGKTITLQQDKATRTNREADTFQPGGFVGHTESPCGQDWNYERNPNGEIVKATWRAATGKFKRTGADTRGRGFTFFAGRHEHYDYNF